MLGWGMYTNSVGNKGQMKEIELDRLGLVSFCLPEPIYLQIDRITPRAPLPDPQRECQGGGGDAPLRGGSAGLE